MTAAAVVDEQRLGPELGSHPVLELAAAPVVPAMPGAMVTRRRLLEPLCRSDGPRLVALVAPAGYGKTTLLADWCEHDRRPFAWLSLSAAHDDADLLESEVRRALRPAAEQAPDGGFVLVLDDLQVLRHPAAVSVVSAIADRLPVAATLAVASRSEPALPIARLRAQRLVTELRAKELAMTRSETSTLLQRAGLRLERDAVDVLLSRTEGWPVGLSLAALSLGDATEGAVRRFGGEDRLVAEFLRDEVLATLAPELHDFVLRTSVLDILTGPLCDAVLERSGSAAVLTELARSNVLLVPMDRTDEHFRYHRLFAETLRAELRRVAPRLAPELHRRASEWCRRNDEVDRGVGHALCAGDVGAAGELVRSGGAAAVADGRSALLDRWLSRFTREQLAAEPTLAVAAATRSLSLGEGDMAAHWSEVAGAACEPSLEAAVATVRAAVCRESVRRTRELAAGAYDLGAGDSPWRSLACLLRGSADALAGDGAAAVRLLEEGAHRAAVTVPLLHALCLAQLAALRIADEDWEGAAALAARARAQVDRYALGADAASALVFAVSAVVRARRGRIEDARDDLDHATRAGDRLTDFPPWYEAELRILSARAAIRLGDVTAARRLLAQAERHAARAADATVLGEWLADARGQSEPSDGRHAGVELNSLTAAELRVLRYLPTHFSFREIAERAYVSANTVKTQANAVYRKLDVSCRSEAVDRARRLGLIDAA